MSDTSSANANADDSSSDGEKGLRYSEDLWDCFEIIARKAEIGLESLKDMASVLKSRVDIEMQYAQQLGHLHERALAGKRSGLKRLLKTRTNAVVAESGTVRSAWQGMIEGLSENSKAHSKFSTTLSESVVQALLEFAKDYEVQIRNLEKRGKASNSQYTTAKENTEKTKNNYIKCSYDAELYNILLEQATKDVAIKPKEWAKLQNKKNTTKQNAADALAEYENTLNRTNEIQNHHLHIEMPKVLDQYQHWDLIRIKVMKSNLNRFNAIYKEVPPELVLLIDLQASSVAEIDHNNDITGFIEENKTYQVPPTDIPFIEYENRLDPNDETIWQKRKGKRAQKPPDALTLLQSQSKPLEIAKKQLFGASLEEIVVNQDDIEAVPTILSTLTKKLFELRAQDSEGIFRVPAPAPKVVELRNAYEELNYDFEIEDVTVAAAVMKLWFRELKHPLIPDELYDEAVSLQGDSMDLFSRLPDVNQKTIEHLARFVLTLAKEEYIKTTLMTLENLAMVFTPSLLRCQAEDPSIVLMNASNEKVFVLRLFKKFSEKYPDMKISDWIDVKEEKSAPAKAADASSGSDFEEVDEVESDSEEELKFDTEMKLGGIENGEDIPEAEGSLKMERM